MFFLKFIEWTYINLTKSFKCQFCKGGFSQHWSLTKQAYKNTEEKHIKCKFCDKGFSNHEYTYNGETAFKWKICDKEFSRYRILSN